MATYTSEAFAQQHYGPACTAEKVSIDFCGKQLLVNTKCKRVFKRMARMIHWRAPEVEKLIRARPDTGTFNCRHIGGDESRPWSNHAFGIAIDILWQMNPYGTGDHYFDEQAMNFVRKAEEEAFYWGGRWGTQDDMHFEIRLTPAEIQQRYFWTGHRKPWFGGSQRVAQRLRKRRAK